MPQLYVGLTNEDLNLNEFIFAGVKRGPNVFNHGSENWNIDFTQDFPGKLTAILPQSALDCMKKPLPIDPDMISMRLIFPEVIRVWSEQVVILDQSEIAQFLWNIERLGYIFRINQNYRAFRGKSNALAHMIRCESLDSKADCQQRVERFIAFMGVMEKYGFDYSNQVNGNVRRKVKEIALGSDGTTPASKATLIQMEDLLSAKDGIVYEYEVTPEKGKRFLLCSDDLEVTEEFVEAEDSEEEEEMEE